MKAIMYHYVREFDENHPNFRFLDIKNFKKQLDFFENEYGFVTKEEWLDYIKGGTIGSVKGKIILTFDDAMSCHYDYVFPELKKRGLWGIFYAPVQPYIQNKLLDVHRIHLLCGALNGKELLQYLLTLITDEMIPDNKREEFHNFTYTKQKNYEGVSEFKRILNYFIDYQYRESMIDQIAQHFNYIFDSKGFYVSPENLAIMKQEGMIIGSHTVNHFVMSKLSRIEQAKQIEDSFKCLEDIGCITHKTYCHPYGGDHSFDENTLDLLTKANVAYSFNVEPREIEDEDIKKNPHALPRFDCNQFPHGAAS